LSGTGRGSLLAEYTRRVPDDVDWRVEAAEEDAAALEEWEELPTEWPLDEAWWMWTL